MKKYFKIKEDTKEGEKFLRGDVRAIGYYVKRLLIHGSCKKDVVISSIIREKPELYKRFLNCLKRVNHNGIEKIWKEDDAVQVLVGRIIFEYNHNKEHCYG